LKPEFVKIRHKYLEYKGLFEKWNQVLPRKREAKIIKKNQIRKV